MKISTKKTSATVDETTTELLTERELRSIVETVVRLARTAGAEETEVHVDQVADALTRFANNAIHQNVADNGLIVSIRTVAEGRTARATTNRIDEDSLRNTINASLSLGFSQPKNPLMLPIPAKQKYRRVNRFSKHTASATPKERAEAVRRACDLAIKRGQVAAGIYSTGQSQTAIGNSRELFASYRETHAEFSVTMQEKPAASWAKANSSNLRNFDTQELRLARVKRPTWQ